MFKSILKLMKPALPVQAKTYETMRAQRIENKLKEYNEGVQAASMLIEHLIKSEADIYLVVSPMILENDKIVDRSPWVLGFTKTLKGQVKVQKSEFSYEDKNYTVEYTNELPFYCGEAPKSQFTSENFINSSLYLR